MLCSMRLLKEHAQFTITNKNDWFQTHQFKQKTAFRRLIQEIRRQTQKNPTKSASKKTQNPKNQSKTTPDKQRQRKNPSRST